MHHLSIWPWCFVLTHITTCWLLCIHYSPFLTWKTSHFGHYRPQSFPLPIPTTHLSATFFFLVFLPYIAPLHPRWNDKAQILSFYQPSSYHARHHTQSLILLFFSFCHKPAIIDPATRHRSEYAPYCNHSFVSYSTFFCSGLSCRHSLLHLSLDLICTHWKQYKPKKIQILINHSITNSTCCHCASTSALFPITVSYRMASWNHFWWGFSEQ